MKRKILIFGSIALDTLITPYGKGENILGGSATYAALSARFFSHPVIISCIGEDFPSRFMKKLENLGISFKGVEVRKGKNFRWIAEYGEDPQDLKVIATYQNVLEDYRPLLPKSLRKIGYVLLANNSPDTQLELLKQLENKKLVVWDTVRFWIENFEKEVRSVMKKVDVAIINSEEAFLLTGKKNLYEAGERLLREGIKGVVVKKGEHGSFFLSRNMFFLLPAYPVKKCIDPTGAGDTFAGAFLSYISRGQFTPSRVKKALIYATVLSSFTVEKLGVEGLMGLVRENLEQRTKEFLSYIKV